MINPLLLAAALALPVFAEPDWKASLPEALAAAKAARTRVLADFTAPWCYSCYYMEKNVLAGAAFAEASRGVVLARIDVDQPEGRELKAKLRVGFIPTFVLLEPDGREAGRLVGEQREEEFLAGLKGLLGPASRSAEDKAVAALEGLLHQGQLEQAEAFAAKPAKAKPEALRQRQDWRRLELRLALKRKPTAQALEAMVSQNDGCDLAYDLLDGLKGSAVAAADLGKLRERLEAWAGRRYWVARDKRCADFRSGIQALAELYARLGDRPAEQALLARAADFLADGAPSAGADRNLDDDRRYLLEAAKRADELLAFYPRLVEAYPSDYVYAYRFAKWLNANGRSNEALPWIEKAGLLCYGANRLAVTRVHAEILGGIGRLEEGARLLEREIKAYGKLLPEEVKPLEALLAQLVPAKKG
ncbi:MAG: thioredoxin family protein [Elusimicrobia bacterium]|nr:thioredoxin family protein [Elusimicrobiota bacterium]